MENDRSNQHSEEVVSGAAQRASQAGPARDSKKVSLGKASIAFVIVLGLLAGVGTFTFGYGRGASYLSNNPETCINCHVMQDHMDSWQKSSHHAVAVCNDCHLPHDPIGKWITKADNGFFHSLAFTLGDYKNPIQIKDRNRRVTQGACLYCHKDFVHNMLPSESQQNSGIAWDFAWDPRTTRESSPANGDTQSCVHCHSGVGHALR